MPYMLRALLIKGESLKSYQLGGWVTPLPITCIPHQEHSGFSFEGSLNSQACHTSHTDSPVCPRPAFEPPTLYGSGRGTQTILKNRFDQLNLLFAEALEFFLILTLGRFPTERYFSM